VELIDRRAENAARFARYRARFSLKHVVILAVIGITLGALLHDIVVMETALLASCLWLQLLGLQAFFLDRLHARAAIARAKNEELAQLL
jgi:arginine exporter protein ArgO